MKPSHEYMVGQEVSKQVHVVPHDNFIAWTWAKLPRHTLVHMMVCSFYKCVNGSVIAQIPPNQHLT